MARPRQVSWLGSINHVDLQVQARAKGLRGFSTRNGRVYLQHDPYFEHPHRRPGRSKSRRYWPTDRLWFFPFRFSPFSFDCPIRAEPSPPSVWWTMSSGPWSMCFWFWEILWIIQTLNASILCVAYCTKRYLKHAWLRLASALWHQTMREGAYSQLTDFVWSRGSDQVQSRPSQDVVGDFSATSIPLFDAGEVCKQDLTFVSQEPLC